MTDLKPLTADNPVVIQAMKEAGIEPHQNGKPAKPVGSSKKVVLPKTSEAPAPISTKKKKLTVELDTAQEMRLLREASNRQMSAKDYLQEIVADALSGSVGRAYITGPSFEGNNGKKIKAPTNSFGREVVGAD